jgi:2-oxoglutarate ferredoxin oxidoreductase subunit gamma
MKIELVIHGLGGQGALTAGALLIEAGLRSGLHVALTPYYTPEVRGGESDAFVVLASDPIGSVLPAAWDVVVLLADKAAPRFVGQAREGSLVLYNSTLVRRPTVQAGVTVVGIAASEIADKLGSTKVANMVLLGALCAHWKAVSVDALKDAVRGALTGLKAKLIAMNEAAIDAGAQALRQAVVTSV